MKPVVSLCIPTNGVVEWVFPVLESIYAQKVDTNKFEVVITDNGDNSAFKSRIRDYLLKHKNIVYAETNALPFLNEIEAYKRANGIFIKFVNHRTLLVEGSLKRLIDFAENNYEEKPVVYFSNGVLKKPKKIHLFSSFDQFVLNLSYWSSWSTGMAIWNDSLKKLPQDVSYYNELFPHTTILFGETDSKKYYIDNTIIFKELPQGKKPKGKYDLFFAFGIEYPYILCNLLRDKSITIKTFKQVTKENLRFLAWLYYVYYVKKNYCSYYLCDIDEVLGVFYHKKDFKTELRRIRIRRLFRLFKR